MGGRRQALVVGVSGPDSVGLAIADALRDRGDAVTVTSSPRRAEGVAALAAERGLAHRVLDIDAPESVEAVFAGLGALDVLVHTLVRVPSDALKRPFLEVERETFCEVLAGSAWSLVLLCRHAAPLLAASGSPRVVTLTSSASSRPSPRYHVAGVGKAALEATVGYLALELGRDGVLVNAVSFSLVATEGARAVVGARACELTRAHVASRAFTRRATDASDVARAVGWLTSPDASNLTGQVITVDGGFAAAYL